jgi:hypothetical protein
MKTQRLQDFVGLRTRAPPNLQILACQAVWIVNFIVDVEKKRRKQTVSYARIITTVRPFLFVADLRC